jgi:nucleoside-diphosphate-sugar epimerase
MVTSEHESPRFEGLLRRVRGVHVLVAGGAGFIGSAIVRELVAAGARTTVLDNFFHGTTENLAGLDEVAVLAVDARDEAAVDDAVAAVRPDVVVNCIGDTYVPSAYAEPQRFFDINVGCHLNLLRAARARGVRRVVYLSSTEVYGVCGPEPVDETTPLDPVNTYAVSKAAADRLSRTFELEHGLPVVVARLFNAYGPRETHPYVIPEVISQLRRGPTVRLGNVHARRDFTYVHDTARAVVALVVCDVTGGHVVNVGSDVSWSVGDLVAALATTMGVEHPDIRQVPERLRRHDIDAFRCDNTRLRALTGWCPQVGLVDGLRRTVEFHTAQGGQWCWESRSHDVRVDDDLVEVAHGAG